MYRNVHPYRMMRIKVNRIDTTQKIKMNIFSLKEKGTSLFSVIWSTLNRSRLLFLLILALFCSSEQLLIAEPLRAKGTGSTVQKAKLNAQYNLASQIQTTIHSVQQISSLNSKVKGQTINDSVYSEDLSASVDTELLGIVFESPTYANNTFSIDIVIPISSLSLYLEKLNTLKKSIEQIESTNIVNISPETQKWNIATLVDTYRQFEAYKYVALMLEPTANIPQLQKTKIGAELDFQQILIEEENRLQSELSGFLSGTKSLSDTVYQQEASIKITEIKNQIQQNQEIQKSIKFDEMARLQEAMENMKQEIKRKAQEMGTKATLYGEKTDKNTKSNSPDEMIQQIEGMKAAYSKISGELEASMNQAKMKSDSYFEKQKAEILNKEYRTAEKVKGVPTQEAVTRRESQVDTLQKATNDELSLIQGQLKDSVAKQLNNLIESIFSSYEKLESTDFVLGLGPNVIIKVDTYDGARKTWPVAIRVSIFGKQIGYDTYISYQNILDATYAEYDKYLDEVDLFQAYFSSIAVPLNIELKYSITPGTNPSEYLVVFKELKLTRMDNGNTVYSDKNAKEKIPSVSFFVDPKIDLTHDLAPYFIKKRNIENEKNKIQNEKTAKQRVWESKKNNLNHYSRKNLFFDIGLSGIFTQLENTSNVGYAFSLKGYWPIMPYTYFGGALEYVSSHISDTSNSSSYSTSSYRYNNSDNYGDVIASTSGLSFLFGVAFPAPKTSEIFNKGFAEIRFGYDSNLGNLITILGLGAEVSPEGTPINIQMGLNIQMTGENSGLFTMTIGVDLLAIYKYIKIGGMF